MVEELMRELSGVVYWLNRIGPRREPWGTPHVREDEGERCGGIETADVRDDEYEIIIIIITTIIIIIIIIIYEIK